MALDQIKLNMLREIADLHGVPQGAYNIRANSEKAGRRSTEHIEIVSKTDVDGIDIIVKPGTKNESVHIPVVIDQTGIKETVHNDFFIGDDCDVVIVAGCGIHNCGNQDSMHDGIHRFFIGKNSKVKYIEKHYGEGDGNGERVMNPETVVDLGENSYMEMETVQIKGIDSTKRKTSAKLAANAKLVINEKIFTHGKQHATTEFLVDLDGANSSTHVTSRSVARGDSQQLFISKMNGNAICSGRTECDAIVLDNGKVSAKPEVTANDPNAALMHEATIGRIAGDQLMKLMTLGLSEKEAEDQIIAGFIK
jgi:Fe-S cluster assembly scaffold protein SufB